MVPASISVMSSKGKRRMRDTKKRPATPARQAPFPLRQAWGIPLALGAVVVVLGGVWALRVTLPSSAASAGAAPSTFAEQPVVRSLRVEVLRALSHERDAYIQGLVWWNDQLFESTGDRGESTLRRLDLRTGEVVQRIDLPDEYFAEGLALHLRGGGDHLNVALRVVRAGS